MDFTHALHAAVPPQVINLCKRLRDGGYRAWLVGGSVRDVLAKELGRIPAKPYDFDVATTATPEQVMAVFRRVIPTGIAHGTVTVLLGKLGVEVTTLRGETTYSDGRHPDQVTFVNDIRADLARRDFTVNAIAFCPLELVIEDPFDGISDLKAGLLRAVGNPDERFGEDGLRVLRAARFAATLRFELEPKTRAAIRPSLESYAKVSAERIADEWRKTLRAASPSIGFQIMLSEGMLSLTAPELAALHLCEQNRYHAYDVWEHTMRVLDQTNCELPTLRLAALLHDLGKPVTRAKSDTTGDFTFYQHEVVGAKMADTLMRRLRFSNDEREYVCKLVRNHLVVYDPSWTDAAVRRWLTRVGVDDYRTILNLARADVLGKGRDVTQELQAIDKLEDRAHEIIEQGAAFNLRDLAVSGKDLIVALKMSPGPLVGRVLNQLLERVLEAPENNQRERLLALAAELLERNATEPQ